MNRLMYVLGVFGYALFFGTLYAARRMQQPGAILEESRLLDLNTASQEEIERLVGIEPDLAERILKNRPYLTKFDLVERRIIPDDAYERIKHSVRVRHRFKEVGAA
jgi:hypothetical protein